jgi:hypothetical protein
VGDVVSIGTGKVVQSGHPPQETSVTDVEDSGLILSDDQVRDFIQAVSDLDYANTRDWQRQVMTDIRQRVSSWPDG